MLKTAIILAACSGLALPVQPSAARPNELPSPLLTQKTLLTANPIEVRAAALSESGLTELVPESTGGAVSLVAAQPQGRLSSTRGSAEPIALRTDDKIALKADFYPPRGEVRRAPAVLLVHGAGDDRKTVTKLAEGLQRAKFGVLAIDLRGHGQSAEGELDWSAMDEEARKSLWAFATRDVEAAARWLSERDGIHSTNLTVLGVGAGGALAVSHAARDENVRCVGLVGLAEENFGFDLISDLRDVEGLPVLIAAMRSQRDAAEELVAEVEGEEFFTVAKMRTDGEEFLGDKKLRKEVVDWVETQAMPKRGRS